MDELIKNVNEYDYPSKLFDFDKQIQIDFNDYRILENFINEKLTSNDLERIKDGLSNVLYWGHFRAGYRDVRVFRFRSKVKEFQLLQFRELVESRTYNSILIKKIKMPEFSGMAFISKILMFLDPTNFVTLDKKIMQLSDPLNLNNPLSNIRFRENDTSISITKNSELNYQKWCSICKEIANNNFEDKIAADIERGFFKLIENDLIDKGRSIIHQLTTNLNNNTL